MKKIYICIKQYSHLSESNVLYEIDKGTQFVIYLDDENSTLDYFNNSDMITCHGIFYETYPNLSKQKIQFSLIKLSKLEIEEYFAPKIKVLITELINS